MQMNPKIDIPNQIFPQSPGCLYSISSLIIGNTRSKKLNKSTTIMITMLAAISIYPLMYSSLQSKQSTLISFVALKEFLQQGHIYFLVLLGFFGLMTVFPEPDLSPLMPIL